MPGWHAVGARGGSLAAQDTNETAAQPLATCAANCGRHLAPRAGLIPQPEICKTTKQFRSTRNSLRLAGTADDNNNGLHDRADRKVVFLICENRVSDVRHADAAHGCVSWRRALASSNGSKLALELKIEIWKDLGLQIHTRHVLRFPIIKRKQALFPKPQ